jgi:hypothetical protein
MMARAQKTKLLLTSLVVLLLSCWLLWIGRATSDAPDKDIFSVPDLASVDSILMESRAGTVLLHFDGTGWRANNKFDVDAEMIDALFATLQQATPKRELTGKAADSVRGILTANGISVHLYARGNLMRHFVCGGNVGKTQAFFSDNDQKIYAMVIPGYRVYVSGIFELTVNDWRNKRVFDFNWRNFSKLEAAFQNAADDYAITLKGSYFAVEGLPETDTARLNGFLDAASLLRVRSYYTRGTATHLDSLLALPASITIRVSDVSRRVRELKIFPPGRTPEVAATIDGEAAVFNRTDILPLAKKREFFAPQTRPSAP